jgi:UDP-N-acetylmuramoylalanine--D-glutamate ligase
MRWAAREALQYLREHHHGSGWVLLAPLAASFDQFRDYRERADTFRAAVRELEGAPWTPS